MRSLPAIAVLVAAALVAGVLSLGGARHAQAAGETCSNVMASLLPDGTLDPNGQGLSTPIGDWEQVAAQCTRRRPRA